MGSTFTIYNPDLAVLGLANKGTGIVSVDNNGKLGFASSPGMYIVSFTANGTWTVPTNVSAIIVFGFGGGGGGGGSNSGTTGTSARAFGGSGGGGSVAATAFATVTPGDTLTITIGAGGTRGSPASNGSDGVDSTVVNGASTTLATFKGAGGGYCMTFRPTASFALVPGGLHIAGTTLPMNLSTGNTIGQVHANYSSGGFAYVGTSGSGQSVAGQASLQGFAGGAAGTRGSDVTNLGGGAGGGGGAGPRGVGGAGGNGGAGVASGTGNSGNTGFPIFAPNTNTGAGGGGGGGGGNGSTAGGSSAYGGYGDNGYIQIAYVV